MASFSLTARDGAALRGRVLAAPAAWSALVVGLAAIGVYYLLPPHAQSIFYVVIGLAAVAAIYVGTLKNLAVGDRLAWNLFSLGLLAEVGGDALSAFYEIHLNREPPTPGLADALYLGGYPLLAVGIFLIVRRLGGTATRAALLDTLVVFIAVGLVQWVFFIDPYNRAAFGSESQRLVAMAYPAMDVLLLAGLAQLLAGRGARTAAYRLLFFSAGLWIVADEVYGLDVNAYHAGNWLDSLWLASYVVWAVAALHPSVAQLSLRERRKLPRLTKSKLVLLAAALLTAPATLLIERVADNRVHAEAIAAGGATIGVIVLLRFAGLVRAVEGARGSDRVARREAEQAQRLLAFQNDQLRELDYLKDEFVSSVSHELRTPLTSISGYTELLLEDEPNVTKQGYLRVIERNSDRLLSLVSDILFAARLQDGRLQLDLTAVDLRELTLHAAEAAAPRATVAGIELDIHAPDVPRVDGEPDRLAQLLDNLISNAIKFTPDGGRVAVMLTASEGRVRVEVSDTGIGISAADRERLFERFFRSQSAMEREIQGTGLGLYISKAIVEAHGGRIGVSSSDGQGTTFVVELPAVGMDA